MIQQNNLKRCREEAGLTKAELERLSGIGTTTIRDIEEHRRGGNPVTKNCLVNGLNKSNNKTKDYKFREVFP